MLRRLRCRFALHAWDPEDVVGGPSHSTGKHFGLMSEEVQTGIQHCRTCAATRLVFRVRYMTEGPLPDRCGKWRICAPETAAWINSLPPG